MLILFDSDFKEQGQVDIDLDFETGTATDSDNTFVLSNATIQSIADLYGFYIEGTEIGGIIEYSKGNTWTDHEELKGFSWRGLMSQAIIEPPQNADYYVVTGEANTILATILSNVLGGFFEVSTADSGLTIDSYQFPLYTNVLDGLEGMLEKYGYRLEITAEKPASGQSVKVYVSAVQAVQISGSYNSDSRVPMQYIVNNMGINHLVCAGQGELQNRMKVDLYVDENGNIGQTQYYTGFAERTKFYDYGSAESEQDLIDNGTKRLQELASAKTLSIKAPENVEMEIGDTVLGVFPDGTQLTAPIVQKIYKISNGTTTIEYKVKGEQ